MTCPQAMFRKIPLVDSLHGHLHDAAIPETATEFAAKTQSGGHLYSVGDLSHYPLANIGSQC